jgi:hypothetical protein
LDPYQVQEVFRIRLCQIYDIEVVYTDYHVRSPSEGLVVPFTKLEPRFKVPIPPSPEISHRIVALKEVLPVHIADTFIKILRELFCFIEDQGLEVAVIPTVFVLHTVAVGGPAICFFLLNKNLVTSTDRSRLEPHQFLLRCPVQLLVDSDLLLELFCGDLHILMVSYETLKLIWVLLDHQAVSDKSERIDFLVMKSSLVLVLDQVSGLGVPVPVELGKSIGRLIINLEPSFQGVVQEFNSGFIFDLDILKVGDIVPRFKVEI